MPLELPKDTLAACRLALLTGLALIVVSPQLAVALEALSNPEIRSIIASRPIIAFELLLALLFWFGLLAWPAYRLYQRLRTQRSIAISGESIRVEVRRGQTREIWSQPLAAYAGIAHYVRSSVSGTRHEVVLEHQRPERTVLLLSAEHITQAEISRISEALELPQIAPKRIRVGRDLPTETNLHFTGLATANLALA